MEGGRETMLRTLGVYLGGTGRGRLSQYKVQDGETDGKHME
jgi:hypothetical protein